MSRVMITTTIQDKNLIFVKTNRLKISAILDRAISEMIGDIEPSTLKEEKRKRENFQKLFEKCKNLFIEKFGEEEFFELWSKNA